MKIKDKAKAKIPPLEPGTYMARCVGVCDIGTQIDDKYKKITPKVVFVWEICGESVTVDGKDEPRVLSRTFTISSGKKSSLRAFLGAWSGKQFTDDEAANVELFDYLDKPCQLSVATSDNGEYANVQAIMGLPRGVKAPDATVPLVAWDMEQWTDDGFAALPEWVQARIKKSAEYQQQHAPTDELGIDDGGCPI